MSSCDRYFERHYTCGSLFSLIKSGERQHASDVSLVSGALGLVVGRSAQVAIAIAEAETSLQKERDIVGFAVQARLNRQAEQVRGIVDAEIQRVDVGTQFAAEESRQCRSVADGVDAPQRGRKGCDPVALDRFVVQIGRAEVRDLARV
jgi:hypothetical protein